jgi:hypothetical protein
MAITDINISEQLETSAPSIKYEGNEGPKSPEEQQQMMMARLEEEYAKYVFEMEEQGQEPMSIQQFIEQAMAEGQISSAQPMPNRQMAAYGGIMDVGGRRRYGKGSWLKKKLRNLIPNEVAGIAEKAAPFVAPFNPLAAGLMSGIGGFDRTGSIGSSLKSGLMNYGGGQLARGIGGGMGNLQTGFNPAGGFGDATRMGTGFGKYFSSPMQSSGGLGGKLSESLKQKGIDNAASKSILDEATLQGDYTKGGQKIIEKTAPQNIKLLDRFLGKSGMNTAAMAGILGASALAGIYTAKNPGDDSLDKIKRGGGMDLATIRTEVVEAFKEPSGKLLAELRIKYPFLGAKETKNLDLMAEGGRIGLYAGGQSIPSEYTMEDAMMTTTQDKLGGITDVMKQADLYRQGDIGQFYAENGGTAEIGEKNISDILKRVQELEDEGLDFGAAMSQAMRELSKGKAHGGRIGFDYGSSYQKNYLINKGYGDQLANMKPKEITQLYDSVKGTWTDTKAQGGRIGADEGGLMNLGGMEKDYRNDGGFVPLGGEEKADEVPARLSKNEFVFTADAVRGAGGGDIDKGAEIMENIMKNLEQGGQISEETQGLSGAQEMFETSQRLGEVV